MSPKGLVISFGEGGGGKDLGKDHVVFREGKEGGQSSPTECKVGL